MYSCRRWEYSPEYFFAVFLIITISSHQLVTTVDCFVEEINMKYSNVYISGIAYELAPIVVTSAELEESLSPFYQKLRIPKGQLNSLTGIQERRWWPENFRVSDGAIMAAKKVLDESGLDVTEIGALLYTGVCRENHEPATACRVAAEIGISKHAAVYDISNACLGVLNGILDVANRIELGQIKAGLVVSCESSRDIVETTIERMLEEPSMQRFSSSLATLTGGSGAVAVLLTDGKFPLQTSNHRLLGASTQTAPEHHDICRWGMDETSKRVYREFMHTDAVTLLKHGVELAKGTWAHFLDQRDWCVEHVDKVICHQVGSANRKHVLSAMNIPEDKEYPTFQLLGNMGTVSIPITAAMAAEKGFLKSGDTVGFLGIGSGLNCMMLGLIW